MQNILKKEDFISIMEDLQKTNDYQIGLNKYFKKHDVDGYIYQPDCSCSVIKLLHIIFAESDADEWISRFCFDYDFGRKSKEDLPFSTFEDLYNVLTKQNSQEVHSKSTAMD